MGHKGGRSADRRLQKGRQGVGPLEEVKNASEGVDGLLEKGKAGSQLEFLEHICRRGDRWLRSNEKFRSGYERKGQARR